jgi:ribonuclease BN (tRNA processing enzyme)
MDQARQACEREVTFMKLTVLGASGGFPAAGGATSGYLLEYDGRHILIDCGSGVLSNMFRFISIDQLDAIILTHLHYDHISDMQVMKYAIDISRKFGIDRPPIPVIAPATPEAIAASLQSDGDLIIGQISAGSELPMYGAAVRFFAMDHPVETYGLSVEKDGRKLAMTADSVPCTNMQTLLMNADLAVMDAGSIERLRKPKMMHMTAAECATLATTCNVKNLLLTHLLPLIEPAEVLAEARAKYPAAELARPLVVYTV